MTWLKWEGISERDAAFHDFVRGLVAIRRRFPLLRGRNFLHGRAIDGNGTRDVAWFRPDGQEMEDADWSDGNAKVIGLVLRDATHRLLILVSAWHDPLSFILPKEGDCRWRLVVDSGRGLVDPAGESHAGGDGLTLEGRTVLLFSCEGDRP